MALIAVSFALNKMASKRASSVSARTDFAAAISESGCAKIDAVDTRVSRASCEIDDVDAETLHFSL